MSLVSCSRCHMQGESCRERMPEVELMKELRELKDAKKRKKTHTHKHTHMHTLTD